MKKDQTEKITITLSANAGISLTAEDTRVWIDPLHKIKSQGYSTVSEEYFEKIVRDENFTGKGPDLICYTHFHSDHYSAGYLKRVLDIFPQAAAVGVSDDGLFFAGDIQSVTEGPVSESDVIARVTSARRNGQLIRSGSKQWSFFEKKWIKTLKYRKYFSRLIFALYR